MYRCLTVHVRACYRVCMDSMTVAELAEKLGDPRKFSLGELAAIARTFSVNFTELSAVVA